MTNMMTKWLKSSIAYMAIVGMTVLSACSDDLRENHSEAGIPFRFAGQIEQQNQTRAGDYGFVDGDRMGIYIVDYANGSPGQLSATDNRASNVLFTFNESQHSWASASTLYWKNASTPVDVYGYYPGVNSVENPASYKFEVSYKQNLLPEEGEMSNYEASDFLWGKVANVSPTANEITVKYTHRMAGVRVQLKAGEGMGDAEWTKVEKSVQVDNTIRTATIDLGNGIPVPDGSVDKSIAMLAQSDGQYRAVVVPQVVKAGETLLTITIGGQIYTHALKSDLKYEGGKLHNFTLTVAKKEMTGDYTFQMTYDGITEWANDEASHQFSSNCYVVINCPEMGTLKECITKAGYDYQTMQNLKVTGELTESDVLFMKNEMPELKHLNLHDVKLKHIRYYDGWWDHGNNDYDLYMDDMMPRGSFYGNKSIRSIVLPTSLKRIGENCFREMQLMYSTLQIPEGVTYIEGSAFAYNDYNGMELIMPNSLDSIEGAAFSNCHFSCEVKLTDNIRMIGASAFSNTSRFHGVFHIPSKLKEINKESLCMGSDGSMTGNIEIPQGVSEIGEFALCAAYKNRVSLTLPTGVKKLSNACFGGVRFNSLHFNDDLEEIFAAFYGASIPFSITLPESLTSIQERAFLNCGIEGELTIPAGCLSMSRDIFSGNNITKFILPDNLESIPEGAFSGNPMLTEIKIPKFVDYIGAGAFAGDAAVQTVICLNPDPPTIFANTFEGLYMDKVILQVPEASVEQYRHADHWKQFQNITAYRELAYNVPEVKALDKGITREGILRAEGDWTVTECPSWVEVSPMQGTGKAEVRITVKPQSPGEPTREGKVVFSLIGKDYTTYTTVKQVSADVAEDATIVLQEASAGATPIPLFIVGDGYDADEIAEGKYLKEIKEQMEHFFSIEPYKTYRHYFTVSTAIACSPQSGLDGPTKFDTENFGGLHGDAEKAWKYALAHGKDITAAGEGKTTIMVLLNTHSTGNSTNIADNGRTVSWMGKSTEPYPFNQQGFVLREVGGTAFGKLAPESVNHFTFIKACGCPGCNMTSRYLEMQARGWWQNVSLSQKMGELPWKHLIFHEKYAQYVDMFEGAMNHARGVYRSENASVMSNQFIPYYNTISREIIVRRIMEYAGKEFNFDNFVANDKIEIPE